MKYRFKNSAFTLAEILITLGIIGVVAAMTISTLIKNYKSVVLRSQFNKAYTSFAQATQMILTQEFDNTNQFENISASTLLGYYQKYMKKAIKCDAYNFCQTNIYPQKRNSDYNYSNENYPNGFIKDNYKTYTGNIPSGVAISNTAIILQDNTFAIIDGATKKYITIDINGWKKAPNKFGHDFFMFQIVWY